MEMKSAPAVRARAPGKVILLGEHAVVYGRTALAATIDRHVEVSVATAVGPVRATTSSTLENGAHYPLLVQAVERAAEFLCIEPSGFSVTIAADLPVAVGLGSSAALSVALVRALARFTGRTLDDAGVCAHSFEIERIFHGFPSGIDNTVATYGGLIAFRRDDAVRPLATARPIPLVIVLGRAPRQTQKTVGALRRKWKINPHLYERVFDAIDRLVTDAERAIGAADLHTLGTMMNANHTLLRDLGVSTDELEHLVALARAEGAWGAKLTGGGGGGAVICVGDTERLLAAFTQAGWQAFTTTITNRQRGSHATDRVDQYADARA